MRWCSTSVRLTNAPIEQMTQINCNDQIAARSFGATEHISPLDVGARVLRDNKFDAVFVTMQKIREPFENRWMDVVHRLKDAGKTVVLFQEAETGWPMTRTWDEIRSFVELLKKVDLFLTHNERDVRTWGQLCQRSMRWKTCIDTLFALQCAIPPEQKPRRPIVIGSSYDSRANGIVGLLACRDLDQPLWHHNRSTGYEDRTAGLPPLLGVNIDREIPHSAFDTWVRAMAEAWLVIHPMPAASAGRDQITLAALGIPCIGNAELDIQAELFPTLSLFDLYDVDVIEMKVKHLLSSPELYDDIRRAAMAKVHEYDADRARPQAARIKAEMGWS